MYVAGYMRMYACMHERMYVCMCVCISALTHTLCHINILTLARAFSPSHKHTLITHAYTHRPDIVCGAVAESDIFPMER
jgi:hypothetical protein